MGAGRTQQEFIERVFEGRCRSRADLGGDDAIEKVELLDESRAPADAENTDPEEPVEGD